MDAYAFDPAVQNKAVGSPTVVTSAPHVAVASQLAWLTQEERRKARASAEAASLETIEAQGRDVPPTPSTADVEAFEHTAATPETATPERAAARVDLRSAGLAVVATRRMRPSYELAEEAIEVASLVPRTARLRHNI